MECFCGLGSFHLIVLSLCFFIFLKYEMPLYHEHHTMFLTVACPTNDKAVSWWESGGSQGSLALASAHK